MEVYLKWRANPARNVSMPGLLTRSEGRLSQSLAVLGKKEYLWALILENGMVNLFRSEGVIYGGREILTRPVWIL